MGYYKYSQEQILDTINTWKKNNHSRKKTQDLLPHINVKSVLEKYARRRPTRFYSSNKILKLARMSGLVETKLQKSVIQKRIGSRTEAAIRKHLNASAKYLNGLPYSEVSHIISKKHSIKNNNRYSRRIILWVDLAKHAKKHRKAFKALAKFQAWLHGTKAVKSKVLKLQACSTPRALSKTLRG